MNERPTHEPTPNVESPEPTPNLDTAPPRARGRVTERLRREAESRLAFARRYFPSANQRDADRICFNRRDYIDHPITPRGKPLGDMRIELGRHSADKIIWRDLPTRSLLSAPIRWVHAHPAANGEFLLRGVPQFDSFIPTPHEASTQAARYNQSDINYKLALAQYARKRGVR